MSRIAILENDTVVNIIEASAEIMDQIFPMSVWRETSTAGPGWTWNGTDLLAPEPPALTPGQRRDALVAAVQAHLDEVARTRNYDGILSLCSYASSTVPKFLAEAIAAVAWRDEVWAYCYQILDDVQAGRRTIPSVDGLISELPTISW